MKSYDIVVFPGQGAQKVGMAKDFVENFSEAKSIFEQANAILPFDIFELCFNEAEKLNQTNYTQVAILTAEIAMFESLKAKYNLNPSWFGGHSLGEYAALIASGVLSFESALKMVLKRGELMHQVDVDGGMSAVIMSDMDSEELAKDCQAYGVEIANDNSLSQVVLSGELPKLQALQPVLEEKYQDKGIRVVPLPVSAPFHSRYMKGIEETYQAFIADFSADFNANHLSKVVSNVTGLFYPQDTQAALALLAKQLSGGVKWTDNMKTLLQQGDKVLEIGPNRPLKGFFSTLDTSITSVFNLKSAERAFAISG